MAGKERPRAWLPLDVDHFAQDSIQELGEEFGPAGPIVFLVALTEAKRHAKGGGVRVAKQGTVSLRYRAVAKTAFLGTDEALVRQIIDACVRVELLEMIEQDDKRFHVRFTKWELWETQDSGGAERQRRHRSKRASTPREPEPQPEAEDDDPIGF